MDCCYDHRNVKFLLTGSSSYYLDSLAGRKIIFEIYPLDFAEFLVFKQIRREVAEWFAQKALQLSSVS